MRLTFALVVALLLPTVGWAGFLAEPIPGAIAPQTAPSTTMVDGVKVTMVTAVSKKDAKSLQAHYTTLFETKGLYLADEVRDVVVANALQVTAIDTDHMIAYTALLQKGANNTTTVIISETALAKQPVPASASFAPILPGAQGVTTAVTEGMETLTYSTVATPAEVKAYYREQLQKMGYAETEELLFAQGLVRISVIVAPGVSMRSVMLVRESAASVATPPARAVKEARKADGGR